MFLKAIFFKCMNFLVRSCEHQCSLIGWRIQRVACMKAALAINAGISETVDDLYGYC